MWKKRAISIFLNTSSYELSRCNGFQTSFNKVLKKKTNLVGEREVGEVACLNMDC